MTTHLTGVVLRHSSMLGFSHWSPERIVSAALTGTPLSDIPGDFVVTAVYEDPVAGTTQCVLTSAVASLPYFMIRTENELVHGRDVFELAARTGLEWTWNARAIRSLAWFGHTIGRDTLHTKVERVPPCSRVTFAQGRVKIDTEDFWERIFVGEPSTPVAAVRVFNEVLVETVSTADPLISLSAGFDSRAILSGALAQGKRPVLLTMGGPDATDRVVAAAMARDLKLDHHVVELQASDYTAHASTITKLTNGTKTAGNWHTYLYPRGTEHLATPHVVGANGEFARTFYLDKGLPLRLAARTGSMLPMAFFLAYLQRRRLKVAAALPGLDLGGPREAVQLATFAAKLAAGPGSGLDSLDRFYATQRVRHFIGNGLALYTAHGRTVSPFLDARWIRAAARLTRREKMGSNHHRRIIETNYPPLLRYPMSGSSPVEARAPAGYWRTGKGSVVGYSPFAEVARNRKVQELLLESSELDAFISREARVPAIRSGAIPAIDFLLTLHYAAAEARRASNTTRRSRGAAATMPANHR